LLSEGDLGGCSLRGFRLRGWPYAGVLSIMSHAIDNESVGLGK
jgi:hypothetical protein